MKRLIAFCAACPVASFTLSGVFAAEPISNTIGGTACFVTMLCTVLPELKRMEQDPLKDPAGDLS